MSTIDPNDHAGRVSGMFGRIAGWYDFLNHFLSLGLDIVWRRHLVRAVRPVTTGRFLDLAAGTLDVSLELRRQHPACTVLAMDFALPMLRKGATKLGSHRYAVQPVQADGRSLPMQDSCVDAVTIAFGIRNILPRQEAYAEILRTLVPGGRLCILEFGTSKRPIWKGVYNFYLERLLPLAGRLISGDSEAYRYLADTIRAFPAAEELEQELRDAGFVNVAHEPLLSGIVNIHVAEKSRFTGDTFVIGAKPKTPRLKTTRTTTAQSAAAPAAAPKAAPAPAGDAAKRAAANLEAGLSAMQAAPEPAPEQPARKAEAEAAPKPKAQAAPAPEANAEAAPKPAPKPAPKVKAKAQKAPAKAAAKTKAQPTGKAKAQAAAKPKAKAQESGKAKPAPKGKKGSAKQVKGGK